MKKMDIKTQSKGVFKNMRVYDPQKKEEKEPVEKKEEIKTSEISYGHTMHVRWR